MVDFAPFQALRFAGKKKDISSFICPPYDVISPQERQNFAERKTPNIIELELPLGSDHEKYSNAADILSRWRNQGALQADSSAAFYLLETTFRIQDSFAPTKALKRYGVLGGLQLETPGKGAVHPHEKTLPKAKEDRLNLLTALRTNVSPVFGLFFDTKKEWGRWIKKTTKTKPLVSGKEHQKLSHRLWKIESPALQKELRKILTSKDLYIADGHHRYEVSWAYRSARAQENPSGASDAGWKRVMAYVCPMEESGLLMLPTHRLVKSNLSFEDWKNRLQKVFDIRPAKNAIEIVNAVKDKKKRKIGWMTKQGFFVLSLRSDISIDRCLQDRPKALRELDVVLLHDVALAEANGQAGLQDREIIFTRDLKEMAARVKNDSAWVGFVLGSPGVASLARVASANEVMPPKTTYFYPKVPTGFTMMELDRTI